VSVTHDLSFSVVRATLTYRDALRASRASWRAILAAQDAGGESFGTADRARTLVVAAEARALEVLKAALLEVGP
jgi:hypothetical protein